MIIVQFPNLLLCFYNYSHIDNIATVIRHGRKTAFLVLIGGFEWLESLFGGFFKIELKLRAKKPTKNTETKA